METLIASLLLGIVLGFSVIYVLYPFITAKKSERVLSDFEEEREARRQSIRREIERLEEDYSTGKILKEEYLSLLKSFKEELSSLGGGDEP